MDGQIDPEVRRAAEAFIARAANKRAIAALTAILEHGFVTTEDLSRLGYEHPPRAIGDLKDHGIPIAKTMVRTSSGRRMARYTLGDAGQIRRGQAGRTAFSRKFRNALLEKYGPLDEITKAKHDPRSLQIDHRIPYRVCGDAGLAEGDVASFMLLDAKSQRAKSWSCEHCVNFNELIDPNICMSCFWAHPENYTHVAMNEIRRVDIVWQSAEVSDYDILQSHAARQGESVAGLLKRLGRDAIDRAE